MICWDGKTGHVVIFCDIPIPSAGQRHANSSDTITTLPLLLRGTGVAMAASSQSKAVLPGWGEGWICSVNPRCKIEKLRTAMWVARRWNQTSAVPKHIEEGLKHRQNHIESWSPTITFTQTQFTQILSSGKKALYRWLDRDVQDGLPRWLFLVVLAQDVAADLKAFGLHPEFEFGVDVAVVDIDSVGLLVLKQGLHDFVVFSARDGLCFTRVSVSPETPVLKFAEHLCLQHDGTSAPFC